MTKRAWITVIGAAVIVAAVTAFLVGVRGVMFADALAVSTAGGIVGLVIMAHGGRR